MIKVDLRALCNELFGVTLARIGEYLVFGENPRVVVETSMECTLDHRDDVVNDGGKVTATY